ncbi:MAG: radical SAM protein [Deltaproteobacteria bacterium]|nr:radical SAM protein [Deltaproteobacteria bacterium]
MPHPLLKTEVGAVFTQSQGMFLLAFPSPYSMAMSSLGFLTVHRKINENPFWCCERITSDTGDLSIETLRNPLDFHIIGFSVSYELEVLEVIRMLQRWRIPVEKDLRNESHPLLVAGGALSTINQDLLLEIFDVVFVGDAEESLDFFLKKSELLERDELLCDISTFSGIRTHYTPEKIKSSVCAIGNTPAWSHILTKKSQFGERMLVETSRGCPRGCTFCTIGRNGTASPFRIVPEEIIFEKAPPDGTAVGLVGAAVSDHPQLKSIVRAYAESNGHVSLSSLRADRLDGDLLSYLAKGGMNVLTVASDGASERIRKKIKKGITAEHIIGSAQIAKELGIWKLKIYEIIGFPWETDEDILEMAELANELGSIIPTSITTSIFVPKPTTVLSDEPFPDARTVKNTVRKFSNLTRGSVRLKTVSYHEARCEYLIGILKPGNLSVLINHVNSEAGLSSLSRSLFEVFQSQR